MNRLLIATAIICFAAIILVSQHRRRTLIEKQNVQLAAMADVLRKRLDESARTNASAEEKLGTLQDELAALVARNQPQRPAASAPMPVPPDATRQGGWPQNGDYFYFPKTFLPKASFQVLNQQQLSDEAADLFNLSEPEREEVNRAIGDLFAQLRGAESERMQLIEIPDEWTRGQFSSAVAYHIPSFSNDVAAWRQHLRERLDTILGAERSQLLGFGLEDHLREDWNDLGEAERTVGFVWHPEANGSSSLWSAIKDRRHGDGTFRRYLPGGPDEPTFRHYADLFGVELPKK
jgi:hypothetical protein